MNLLNKLLCKLFGHKWRPKLKDMYCIRCGVSRPKTFCEYLGYDSLFAKYLSKEIETEFFKNVSQELYEISQKQYTGELKDIGNTVKIYDYGLLDIKEDK